MADLELISTDDLLAEVSKRYSHFVFTGIQEYNEDQNQTCVIYTGDLLKCMGILDYAKWRIIRDYHKTGV